MTAAALRELPNALVPSLEGVPSAHQQLVQLPHSSLMQQAVVLSPVVLSV